MKASGSPALRALLWAAAWSALAVVLATLIHQRLRAMGAEPRWSTLVLGQLLLWAPWAAATPLLHRLNGRWRKGGRWRLLAHLPAALVMATTAVVVSVLGEVVLAAGPEAPTLESLLKLLGPTDWVPWLAFYGLVAFVSTAVHRRHRERTLETLLTEARLEALEAKLDPHFLFNALNAVSSLVEEDPPAARRMIARLADLLRLRLRREPRREVPLLEELEALESYLAVEKVRFGPRLRVIHDVAAEAHSAAVPPWSLQPLVENALTHGLARDPRAGAVLIRAARRGERLRLEVLDDGPGLSRRRPSPGAGGLGLANVRQRIEELYGGAAFLTLEARKDDRGAHAVLEIPWRPLTSAPAGDAGTPS